MKRLISYLKKVRALSYGKTKDNKAWSQWWNTFYEKQSEMINDMEIEQAIDYLISSANHIERHKAKGCSDFNVNIEVGDVCYIDFGTAYINEIGYQHFGLILSIRGTKAFVVPMSGNQIQYQNAYDEKSNPLGKKHLMRFEKLPGMVKNTALFLSDAKWINTARIIDVKAHLNCNSKRFAEIKCRVKDII